MTDDFFRNRLDQLIDLRYQLAVLANRMPWQEIEASLAHRRKLPQIENNMKIEASISLRRRDEEVKVHGEPDCCNLG